jgi:L-2-hydroxyglutarate oxidase LhgO
MEWNAGLAGIDSSNCADTCSLLGVHLWRQFVSQQPDFARDRVIARQQCAVFAWDCEIDSVQWQDGIYEVKSGSDRIKTRTVINCAGLGCDRIAALAGINIDRSGYRLHYSKGEYYRMAGFHPAHLIYPLPGPAGLGIHTTTDMSGACRLGPDSYRVDKIDYGMDENRAAVFFNSAHKYLPGLKPEDISPDMAGIRPTLPGDGFRDFKIAEESEKGLPGLISLIGIESPGLTSSLAIGQYVADLFAHQHLN